MEESRVGEVLKYFDNLNVAVVKLYGELQAGDQLHFRGSLTDFEQSLDSMEENGTQIEDAQMGHEIGLKVTQPVQAGDMVFKVSE